MIPSLDDLVMSASALFPGQRLAVSHLLVAWARRDGTGGLGSLLAELGADPARVLPILESTARSDDAEDAALLDACLGGTPTGQTSGWHLLSALCANPRSGSARALVAAGVDLGALHIRLQSHSPVQTPILAAVLARHATSASTLERYGRDLTRLAREGRFDDLEERPGDLERLEDVLQKKQTGNAALTGEPGVGKTAIVETLARRIARGVSPRPLAGCQVFEISMGTVVAGTHYRGDFEQRMDDIIKCARSLGSVILFFDELHTVWGAGRAEGAPLDAANMLKPALGRGEIHVIGATTVDEYHHYIRRDEALARRFEEVRILEPAGPLLRAIVLRQAAGLQAHHAITIDDRLVDEAIGLTNLHITARRQPDKTVSALDSACLIAARKGRQTIQREDVFDAVSRLAGVDIAPAGERTRSGLQTLERRLGARIVGQDEAVRRVVSVLAYRVQALGDEARCKGTFLFAGATGVGKTEMARAIAAEHFGASGSLLLLDMGEYSGAGGLEKLLGSAPGYVGSEREGVLARWWHERGCGLVCFDEIEKASRDITALLLAVLESGRARTGKGEVLDLRQSVISVTTNAITAEDLKQTGIGFQQDAGGRDAFELLARHFPREFLGRFDDIVVFNTLSLSQLRGVLRLRLEEARARLETQDCRVVYDEDRLVDFLLGKLEHGRSGARGVARLLEREVLQPIALARVALEPDERTRLVLDDEFFRSGTVTRVRSDVRTPHDQGGGARGEP